MSTLLSLGSYVLYTHAQHPRRTTCKGIWNWSEWSDLTPSSQAKTWAGVSRSNAPIAAALGSPRLPSRLTPSAPEQEGVLRGGSPARPPKGTAKSRAVPQSANVTDGALALALRVLLKGETLADFQCFDCCYQEWAFLSPDFLKLKIYVYIYLHPVDTWCPSGPWRPLPYSHHRFWVLLSPAMTGHGKKTRHTKMDQP